VSIRRPAYCAIAALLIGAISPASAQQTDAVRDPRDRYVAKDAPAPASNWKDQPWWIPLAECAAVFASPPEERAEFQKFAGHAMMRLADDRSLKAEEAAGLVLPWTQGRGRQRADMMTSAFGTEAVRANCDKLFEQYQAL
jgi:hypothetical protein